MQNNIFEFLEGKFPNLAQIGGQIEEVFYLDPQSVLMKGRVFTEELIKEIAKYHEELNNIKYLKLFERIQLLESEDILTKEIARSFDSIRYLGNKANHEFMEVDLENAFKMHKRLFEVSVWFMELYGDYSFEAPKYKSPQPKNDSDLFRELKEKTSSLEEKLELILEASKTTAVAVELEGELTSVEADVVSEPTPQLYNRQVIEENFEFSLDEGESHLLKELSKLKESAQEAVENANQFSGFKEYLHVKRSIQDDLERVLNQTATKSESQLILLCGSVGDGKSHLLAYMKNKHSDLVNRFQIHNDATESFDPQKSSLDTLAEVLEPFNDERIEESQDKLILAINLGVLHNFMESVYAKEDFRKLANFIETTNVFETSTITETQEGENFYLLSFSDYQPFELMESEVVSEYYSSLLDRLIVDSEDNPFYQAYLKDKESKIQGFFMTNYELLMLPELRKEIIKLLIQVIVKYKMIISTRSLLNFIHDILVPANNIDYGNSDIIQKTEGLLPYLLFEGKERSPLLSVLSELDPIHKRSNKIDQILIELNNTLDVKATFEKYLDLSSLTDWKEEIVGVGAFHDLTDASRQLYNKGLIRFSFFLADNTVKEVFIDHEYNDYLSYLYYYNTGDRTGLRKVTSLLKESISLWNGTPKNGYIYIDKSSQDIQVAQSLAIKPYFGHLKANTRDSLERFHLSVILAFGDKDRNNPNFIEIDYPLYEMLVKLSRGYRPNKKDKEDCIQFVEYIDKIMKHGNKDKELLFVNLQSNKTFKLTYDDDYEEFTFRRD